MKPLELPRAMRGRQRRQATRDNIAFVAALREVLGLDPIPGTEDWTHRPAGVFEERTLHQDGLVSRRGSNA